MTHSLALEFEIHDKSGHSSVLTFAPARFVIAGWAGRDEASLRHHIDELAAIGIAPPSTTPLFYRAAAGLLTQAPVIQILGADSSGEAEPLLVASPDGFLIGIGSDHTDRDAEAWSVAHSKQLCGKPVGKALWRFADVAGHWDEIMLRSWMRIGQGDWVLYQEGAVAGLRRPDDLARLAGDLGPGTAMLCGTLSAIGGIRPSDAFRIELHDPVLGRRLTHEYQVVTLPVVV